MENFIVISDDSLIKLNEINNSCIKINYYESKAKFNRNLKKIIKFIIITILLVLKRTILNNVN